MTNYLQFFSAVLPPERPRTGITLVPCFNHSTPIAAALSPTLDLHCSPRNVQMTAITCFPDLDDLFTFLNNSNAVQQPKIEYKQHMGDYFNISNVCFLNKKISNNPSEIYYIHLSSNKQYENFLNIYPGLYTGLLIYCYNVDTRSIVLYIFDSHYSIVTRMRSQKFMRIFSFSFLDTPSKNTVTLLCCNSAARYRHPPQYTGACIMGSAINLYCTLSRHQYICIRFLNCDITLYLIFHKTPLQSSYGITVLQKMLRLSNLSCSPAVPPIQRSELTPVVNPTLFLSAQGPSDATALGNLESEITPAVVPILAPRIPKRQIGELSQLRSPGIMFNHLPDCWRPFLLRPQVKSISRTDMELAANFLDDNALRAAQGSGTSLLHVLTDHLPSRLHFNTKQVRQVLADFALRHLHLFPGEPAQTEALTRSLRDTELKWNDDILVPSFSSVKCSIS